MNECAVKTAVCAPAARLALQTDSPSIEYPVEAFKEQTLSIVHHSETVHTGEMCRPHNRSQTDEVLPFDMEQFQARLAHSISRWFHDDNLTSVAVKKSLKKDAGRRVNWHCDYCNYTTESGRERRFHLRVHKKSGDWSCVDCGARFGGLRGLREHRKHSRSQLGCSTNARISSPTGDEGSTEFRNHQCDEIC